MERRGLILVLISVFVRIDVTGSTNTTASTSSTSVEATTTSTSSTTTTASTSSTTSAASTSSTTTTTNTYSTPVDESSSNLGWIMGVILGLLFIPVVLIGIYTGRKYWSVTENKRTAY